MTTPRAIVEEQAPSRQVLSELPARVVVFLSAVGRDGTLQAALARGGYTADDHNEGWVLLQAACAFTEVGDPSANSTAENAAAEIRAWCSQNFKRLETAVARLHPNHGDLFAGLEAHDEPSAILAVAALLTRIDEKQRKGAVSLVATLARRRLDAAERARLGALVEAAQQTCSIGPAPLLRVSRRAELTALYHWYRDWTTTARSVLGRKSLQIALGLASRSRRAGFESGKRPEG